MRAVFVIAAAAWALLLGGVCYVLVEGFNRDSALDKQVRANCVVVSVLLDQRADRDETIKLFDPIRRQNPRQFDKLVRRAERGDKKLQRVSGDLACKP